MLKQYCTELFREAEKKMGEKTKPLEAGELFLK